MANAAQIVAAFRDVASTKSLSEEEMTDLVKDGMLAGLARIYGPTVQAEIDINEDTGDFDMVVLPGGEPGTTNLAANTALRAVLKRFANESRTATRSVWLSR